MPTLMKKLLLTLALFLLVLGGGLSANAQTVPTFDQPISTDTSGDSLSLPSLSGGADIVLPQSADIATPGASAEPGLEEQIAANAKDAQNRRAIESTGGGFAAQVIGWIALKPITYLLFVINYIVGFVGSLVFQLAALLVEISLYLNTTILTSQVVQLGWRIVRDLANLGFTIGIVVIAYATMLGNESFAIKKTLLNFIVAAVMINFSFAIAGFMIDASNLVTHFFISKSTGGGFGGSIASAHELTLSLGDAFGPQKLIRLNDAPKSIDQFRALGSQNGGLIAAVASVFFIALFTIMAALGMLAIGLTAFKRFLLLSIAIIVMPMAILCSVFPKTQKHWTKWKGEFFDQLFYLPVATFAIYLVLTFVTVKAKAVGASGISTSDLGNAFSAIKTTGGDWTLSSIARPFQVMTDMIITLGLMMTAITQSSKMSGTSGKIAVGWAEGVRDWAIGKAKSIPGTIARRTLTSPTLSGSTNGVKDPNKNLGNRIGNRLATVPFVRGLVPKLKDFMAGPSAKKIAEHEKEYGALNDQQLLATARGTGIRLNPERMAAMAKVIAAKGKFNETDPTKGLSAAEFGAFTPSAKRFGMDKEILKTSPHLYEKFGWDNAKLASFMAKDFNKEAMEKINPEALKNKEVVKNLRNRDLKVLNGPDKDEHRANMIATLGEIRTDDAIASTTDFKDFMGKNFKDSKDIDDIHTDFLEDKDFVLGLKPQHIARIESEDEFERGAALIKTMNETYKDIANFTGPVGPAQTAKIKTLDSFAQRIVNNQNASLWSGLATDSATQQDFEDVRDEYLKRHPGQNQAVGGRGGAGTPGTPQNPPKGNATSSRTSSPSTNAQKTAFLDSLESYLSAMLRNRQISPDEARKKREGAALIETGLSNNPDHDAESFALNGIASIEAADLKALKAKVDALRVDYPRPENSKKTPLGDNPKEKGIPDAPAKPLRQGSEPNPWRRTPEQVTAPAKVPKISPTEGKAEQQRADRTNT